MAGYWYNVDRPCVCPSVVRLYFRFRMITSKCQRIFTKLGLCIDIREIWFGIAQYIIGKFRQFLTEVSARDTFVFSFPDNNK